MDRYYKELLNKYVKTGVLLDSNLYVLLLVGRFDVEIIASSSITRKYDPENYYLLERIVQQFQNRYTTPNIVTETSNLVRRLRNDFIYGVNSELATDINIIDEKYISSQFCTHDPMLLQFGIADTAIKTISENSILVLTDDGPLFGYLSRLNLPVIYFTYLRQPGT